MHDDPEVSDRLLVDRCRCGDAAAWSALVRRYASLVYTVPRRARLSAAAVDDVFQITWTRLVENLDMLDDPSRVRAWLVTTALRETLAQIRDVKRGGADTADPFDTDAVPDPGPTPETIVEQWQDARRLRLGVQQLDRRCREILTAIYLSDPPEPQADLADRIGVAKNSISPLRTRCLGNLLRWLEHDDAAAATGAAVRSDADHARWGLTRRKEDRP